MKQKTNNLSFRYIDTKTVTKSKKINPKFRIIVILVEGVTGRGRVCA